MLLDVQMNDRLQLQAAGCAAVFEPEGSLYYTRALTAAASAAAAPHNTPQGLLLCKTPSCQHPHTICIISVC